MTPAVVGIAQVRAGRRPAPSAAALAARAIATALRDAGVRLEDVDGIVRFDREAAWEYDLPGLHRVRVLGYYGAVPDTPGSGAALVRLAAMAISQELARVVVAYHARSEGRPGTPAEVLAAVCGGGVEEAPASGPGGCALVVRALEHAGRGRHVPVHILGSSQVAIPSAARHLDAWLASRRDGIVQGAARRMFEEAAVRPDEVDVACLYARPAELVPLALEDMLQGVWHGDRPRVNPHAGSPVAVGLDGVDDVLEAVRQLRGEAARQVHGARVALVASSPLEPTSAALLGAGP